MSGTQQTTFPHQAVVLAPRGNDRLPIPEAAMFIVASAGALWARIFGAMSWMLG
jgi:hypothetical protein